MFTNFDILVISIILFSSLIGFFRGIIKEFFGIFKWVGSGALILLLYPAIVEKFGVENSPVTSTLILIAVFLAIVLAISALTSMWTQNLGNFKGSITDKLLGSLLGFLRGFIIIAFAHFVWVGLNGGKEPKSLKEGATYSLTNMGAAIIRSLYDKEEEEENFVGKIYKDTKKQIEDTEFPDIKIKEKIKDDDYEIIDDEKDIFELKRN